MIPRTTEYLVVCIEPLGIAGIVVGRSTCDPNRYQISFFDRHFWQVRHRWFAASQLTLLTTITVEAA